MPKVDKELNDLKMLLAGLPAEFANIFAPKVRKEINKLVDIRTKYLKNYITETMLRTISAKDNMHRMLTPISFDSITNAIDSVEDYVPTRRLDLSNIRDKQAAYDGLSAGMVLTGAFANAVKVIAYLSRTGVSPELAKYLGEYESIRTRKKELLAHFRLEEVLDEINELNKLIEGEYSQKEKVKRLITAPKSENTPLLNMASRFNLNGTAFTKLEYWDSEHNYKVSEVFDALINAAIDNLKLGHLSDARINVVSGSTVVGLLSVGVPMNTIVQMMYQPIFDPLFSGKINRLDIWLAKLKENEKVKKALENYESQDLQDSDLLMGLEFKKALGRQATLDDILKSPELLASQIQALTVFEKGNRIGEDIRNLADFMNIIRELDVFVEDIDQQRANFNSKIGQVIEDGGNPVLITKSNFSLWIPNLFSSNPHLHEAFKTFETLEEVIERTFPLHSAPARTFARKVYDAMNLSDEGSIDSVEANLVDMRRSLAAYLMTSLVWDDVQDTQQIKIAIPGTKMKTTLSLARSYSEKVVDKLTKIRNYAIANQHKNTFLDYVSAYRDDFGVLRINFKGGVNLNSSDVESIVKGYSQLAKYSINKDGEVRYDETRLSSEMSDIQRELMNYAIINYGLQFSTTNYSNYIPASHLQVVDVLFEESLRRLVNNMQGDTIQASSIVNQFKLIYAVKNGDRLAFVPRERMIPFYETESYDADARKVTTRVYQGVATVENSKVYYDRKVRLDPKTKTEQFIRVSFDNRTSVYKLVMMDDTYAYYQVVGKNTDIFFSPLPKSDLYSNTLEFYRSTDYFDPFEFTLIYSDVNTQITNVNVGDELVVTSMTSIQTADPKVNFIEIGQEFWVSPAYNADRTSRLRVKLLELPKKDPGNKRGFTYKVQVVAPKVNMLKSIPGSRVSYANYFTREDVLDNPTSTFLYADVETKSGAAGVAAQLRNLPNAIGIPVKKAANSKSESFYSDEEFEINKAAIDAALEAVPFRVPLIVPSVGFGVGLGDLANKAPKTLGYIRKRINELSTMELQTPELDAERSELDKIEDNCNNGL